MGGSSNGWLHRIHKFRPTLWFCRLAGWLAALSPTESERWQRYAGVWQSVLNVSDDTAYKLQKCCSIGKPRFQLARSMRDAQGHHHPHHWLQCGDCGVQEPWTSLHGLRVGNIPAMPSPFAVLRLPRNLSFTVWDVGGQDKIRPLWRHYYQGSGYLEASTFACKERTA